MKKRETVSFDTFSSDGAQNHISEVSPSAQPEPVEASRSEPKPAFDPFDPVNMRLSQATLKAPAKKLVTSYSIRKVPRPGSFCRVHPGEDYQHLTYIFEDTDEAGMERDTYLISPPFLQELAEEYKVLMKSVILCLALERHAEKPFVWKIRLPLDGARDNDYWRTAREIADMCKTEWLRVYAEGGCYAYVRPNGKMPEPIWPEVSFGEILRLAFKNRVIDSMEHPIMQNLAGVE